MIWLSLKAVGFGVHGCRILFGHQDQGLNTADLTSAINGGDGCGSQC